MRRGPIYCNVYALYKGDEFIDVGTKKELAERLNVEENYIYRLGTPGWKNRERKNKKDFMFIVKTGKENDDLEEFEDIDQHIPRID